MLWPCLEKFSDGKLFGHQFWFLVRKFYRQNNLELMYAVFERGDIPEKCPLL